MSVLGQVLVKLGGSSPDKPISSPEAAEENEKDPTSEFTAISEIKSAGLLSFLSEAPSDYVSQVAAASEIPEEHVRTYVKNIRPHRFNVSAQDFARDLKPVWSVKEQQYNPLQAGLLATSPGSPEEEAYLAKHKANLDKHLQSWMHGQADLRKRYTGGDTMGEWAAIEKLRGETKSAMLEELGALNALPKVASDGISDEEAAAALARLKKLEASKPTVGETGRAALVGSVVGPAASLAWRAIAGKHGRHGQDIWPGVRPILATAGHGAVFGGAMPVARATLERSVEKQKLREYIGEKPRGSLRSKIKRTTGL